MFTPEIGAEVMCTLARAPKSGGIRSGALWAHEVGVVERVEPCTVFVRLVGLVESPYSAGDYLPLNRDKVEPLRGWSTDVTFDAVDRAIWGGNVRETD